ncbi:hypothetical protein MTO96_047004, partial [Rhipicephalus appendiculatus]
QVDHPLESYLMNTEVAEVMVLLIFAVLIGSIYETSCTIPKDGTLRIRDLSGRPGASDIAKTKPLPRHACLTPPAPTVFLFDSHPRRAPCGHPHTVYLTLNIA